jgi:hypothetical protein
MLVRVRMKELLSNSEGGFNISCHTHSPERNLHFKIQSTPGKQLPGKMKDDLFFGVKSCFYLV